MEDGTTPRENKKYGPDWYRVLTEQIDDLITVVVPTGQ
jgi:hypothetical protein